MTINLMNKLILKKIALETQKFNNMLNTIMDLYLENTHNEDF